MTQTNANYESKRVVRAKLNLYRYKYTVKIQVSKNGHKGMKGV